MQSIAKSIVETARSYEGTRWQHQGRIKGVGIDCIGLVVETLRELGLTGENPSNYGRTPDGVAMRQRLNQHLTPVPFSNRQEGDIILFRFTEAPQHVAFLTTMADGREGIIHAFAGARKVVEHGFDDVWKARVVQCFRVPAVMAQGAA